jgi:hypothetical protein
MGEVVSSPLVLRFPVRLARFFSPRFDPSQLEYPFLTELESRMAKE